MRLSVQLDSRQRGDGSSMVRICLYDGSRQLRIPLDIWVSKAQWDNRRRRVQFGKHNMAAAYNARISEMISRIEQVHDRHPGITLTALRSAVLGQGEDDGSFVALAIRRLKEHPPRSYYTIKGRTSCYTRFGTFFQGTLQQLTPEAMEAYCQKLKEGGLAPNGIAIQVKLIRTAYRALCRDLGIAQVDILRDCDAVERYGGPPPIRSRDEIRRLAHYADVQEGWASKAVRLWLFSLYCGGIRIGDALRLTQENLSNGRLVYTMSKTLKERNIMLVPEALAILDLYKGGRMLFAATEDKPTPQKIAALTAVANKNLRKAALACGISGRLSTHTARHSFAALALDSGMDDRLIQQVMSLSDAAYRHYRSRFRQDQVDKGIQQVVSLLG
jgi:site-specific recombinase XerD